MFIVWHFVAAGFISSIVVSLVQHGLALPLAPEPAEGSSASPIAVKAVDAGQPQPSS